MAIRSGEDLWAIRLDRPHGFGVPRRAARSIKLAGNITAVPILIYSRKRRQQPIFLPNSLDPCLCLPELDAPTNLNTSFDHYGVVAVDVKSLLHTNFKGSRSYQIRQHTSIPVSKTNSKYQISCQFQKPITNFANRTLHKMWDAKFEPQKRPQCKIGMNQLDVRRVPSGKCANGGQLSLVGRSKGCAAHFACHRIFVWTSKATYAFSIKLLLPHLNRYGLLMWSSKMLGYGLELWVLVRKWTKFQ